MIVDDRMLYNAKPRCVMHVQELFARGRGLSEDPEPCERIDAFVGGVRPVREGRARHAMRSVASGDEVAVNGVDSAIFHDSKIRLAVDEIVQRDGAALEPQIAAVAETTRDEIFDDFLLAVDGDGFSG